MKRLAILLVVAAFMAGTSLAGDKGTKSSTGTSAKGKKEMCEDSKGCCGAGKSAKAQKSSSDKKQAEEKAPESK